MARAAGVRTTRRARRWPVRTHLEALTHAHAHLERLALGKPLVHIVAAEGDAVGPLRHWAAKKQRFVTRGDDLRWVRWQGQACQVATILPQLTMRLSRPVQYHGQTAQQYVGATPVTLHRPAREHRIVNGRHVPKTRQPLELSCAARAR